MEQRGEARRGKEGRGERCADESQDTHKLTQTVRGGSREINLFPFRLAPLSRE